MACGGGGSSPAAPSPAATIPAATTPAPTPGPSPTPTPAPPAATFTIDLPISAGDAVNDFGGVNPFGVHLADHGVDGHPGWDFQYRIGGLVRAAADGTVQSIAAPEAQRPNRFVVQVSHQVSGRNYRTVYFGVENVRSAIVVNASISRGAVIGEAAVLSQVIGTAQRTYATIHFQVDDFSYSGGLTNQNAVSPALFLSAGALALFTTLWNDAAYSGEPTEPFWSNPRDVTFPMTRRWTRQRGDLAEIIELTRPNGTSNDYSYRMLDAAGAVIESGTAQTAPFERPFPTIDLSPTSGGSRRGLYDIVNNSMRLVLGAAGASRPTGFTNESSYTTTGSASM